MLKTDFPPIFDSTTITPKRLSWEYAYETISNINQTESGHDDVEVIRTGKLSIGAQFQVTDRWAAIFTGFYHKPMITVKDYDVETQTYKERTMRIEGYNVSLVNESDKLGLTNGLYIVTFTLVEY